MNVAHAQTAGLAREAVNTRFTKGCAHVSNIEPQETLRDVLVEEALRTTAFDFLGESAEALENRPGHSRRGNFPEAGLAQPNWSHFHAREIPIRMKSRDDDEAFAFERRRGIARNNAAKAIEAERWACVFGCEEFRAANSMGVTGCHGR